MHVYHSIPVQVVYQNILQLSYIDKLLDQVQLQFRDRYKNKLLTHSYSPSNYSNFGQSFTVSYLVIVM